MNKAARTFFALSGIAIFHLASVPILQVALLRFNPDYYVKGSAQVLPFV
jgi:hypothetical protein